MQAPASADETDVISEADLFLNYGRDAQAEDLLKEALAKKPGNTPIQLKLLSIYAIRKDLNKFTTIARQIKDSGDQAAWEQTAALGRTVDQGNPMYGEASGAAPAAITDILTESGKQGVKPLDMDVGFNIPMDLDVTAASPTPAPEAASMDFDVSSYSELPVMDMDVTGAHEVAPEALLPDFDVTGGHTASADAQSMDFDVTGSHPNVVGASSMDFDVTGSQPNVLETSGMDFDITGSHPNVVAETPGANMSTVVLDSPMFGATPASASGASGGGMDFDFSVSPSAPGTGMEPSGSGMDFDLSAAPTAVGTGMEPSGSGMDFDLSISPSATALGAAEAPGMEPSSSGMDFDLSAAPSIEATPPSFVEPSFGLGGLDFDITGSRTQPAAEEPAAHLGTASAPMDLDVSGPAVVAAASTESSFGMGGLDFDVTGSHAMFTPETHEDTTSTVVLNAPMDFDISAPSPTAAPANEAPTPAAGGMDFDLSTSSSVIIPAASGDLASLGGMDFDISATQSMKAAEPAIDLSGISLDVGAAEGAGVTDTVVFPAAEGKKDDRWQDVQNKLELATAFLEGMGDVDTARELLGEVLNEGDTQQVESARTLIQKI